MAIKSRNKTILAVWILLFTFGINGILVGLFNGREYVKKDYFQTQQFQEQLHQFIDYLKMFELDKQMNKEEIKKNITVTDEEIEEHRYRYGDLLSQVTNIKSQYEQKIQDALVAENKEVADAYIAERDKKIADITNNFKNTEHVRAKIVKEKEQKIDEYFWKIEEHRPEFTNYKGIFTYYLKDTATGEIHTNVDMNGVDSIDKVINNKNMVFIQTYPSEQEGYLVTDGSYSSIGYDELITPWIQGKTSKFQGQIALSKAASSANKILMDYKDFREKQIIFFVHTISGIIALLLSLYMNKKTPILSLIPTEKWQPYYNRIPIDVAGIILVCTGIFMLMFFMVDNNIYANQYVYSYVSNAFFKLLAEFCLVTLTLIQGKLWIARMKDAANRTADWQKALVCRMYRDISDAFMVWRVGTQLVILLSAVFAFGAGAAIVLVEPGLIVFYAPLFIVVGIPLLIIFIKYAGYFNRIVRYTEEIVQGHSGPDLPVTGKSAFAVLAGNVNILKHGIKTSQKEQAKSERLKTELITNVSHDLRTPLTSIITYTELLKKPDIADDERDSYIEIIDRKSQRLKVLIDDLFEASKMASGNIELVKERVDIVQLLQQALAEYTDKIKESTLQFRITNPDAPVYAMIDGQKLWRVFDNLIGNILNYSLENTRVYISMKKADDKAVITFKNVTKYELSEDVDELFERFKRGDTSRHTEGSGLGLAIAKSIIDLHGGEMDMEVDGDLFKVTISLHTS